MAITLFHYELLNHHTVCSQLCYTSHHVGRVAHMNSMNGHALLWPVTGVQIVGTTQRYDKQNWQRGGALHYLNAWNMLPLLGFSVVYWILNIRPVLGGHRFLSHRGRRIFSSSHARGMSIIN